MSKVAVITGAGSGVGRAISVQLGREGWEVVLLGRNQQTLDETAKLVGAAAWPIACDISSREGVRAMSAQVLGKYGSVQVLVNSAGTNVPQRSLEVLNDEDYDLMLGTNLNGAYYCVQAFLPGMRKAGSGTIVNVVSDAGLKASPKAGPGYVISKFGMAGLTQAINAEERGRGVRATSLFPGDINTGLLDRRPTPPPAEAREHMLRPEDVAACAMLAINLPSRAIIEELLVRPR